MLYENGAKEVHVRIACPEIKYLFFWIDMLKEKLLAHEKNNDEMSNLLKQKLLILKS